jgi:RNA-binding protein
VANLTSHDLAALRATGQTLGVAFQVGKDGVSEGVVKELQARLERDPLVKVKILASAREDADAKALAQGLAQAARVTLVEVRGHTALFYRPPRHKRGPQDF